jgi:hypothetical protein
MRRMPGSTPLRALLVLLAALAAAVMPGAHHRGPSPGSAERLAYAMPDGTLPSICGEDGMSPAHAADRCLDCLTLAAPLIAARLPAPGAPAIALVEPPADAPPPGGRGDRAASARAPPAFA